MVKRRYELGDEVIKANKYWLSKDSNSIVKVIEDKYHSVGFMETSQTTMDRIFYTSSVGFFYNYKTPITEDRYNELYKQFTENN